MKNTKLLIVLVLTVLSWWSCKTTSYVADIDTSYDRIGKWTDEDQDITALIKPYKVQLDQQMNEVIGHADIDMVKGKPNSTLGSWFVDILQEEAERIYGVDVAFAAQNYGGIRVQSVAAGDISVGTIYEVMPFDNKLVVLKAGGAEMKKLLDMIASHGGWPVSDHLRMTIDGDKAKDIYIDGEAFDTQKTYYIALPDYIANGGDKADFLISLPRMDKDLMLRDIVIDHLKKLNSTGTPMTISSSERITK